MEEHERIKRQSLESAVEDKIRRQVKQVLDAAQVRGCGLMLVGVVSGASYKLIAYNWAC